MNDIRILQSTRKQAVLVFCAVVAVSVSVFVFLQGDMVPAFIRVVGMLGALFFGMCLVFIAYRLIKPKEILIINAHGFVSWEYVEEIYITSMMNQKFISVKTNESFTPNCSKGKMIFAKINAFIGYEGINITLQSSSAKIDDVLDVMQEHLAAYRSK